MADEQDQTPRPEAGEDQQATPEPETGETHGSAKPAPEASHQAQVADTTQPSSQPPSGSASVAAETAPAQITEGSSAEVDAVPAPDAEAPVYRTGMFGVHGSGDTSGYGGLQRRVPVTPTAERPYGGWYDDADAALARAVPEWDEAIERVTVDRGELTYHVRRESLLAVLRGLRDDPSLRFELLSMVGGVHYPDDTTGRPLHSVYQLTSLTYRRRIRVEVAVSDADPHLPSAVPVYPTADWQEREAYDMYGLQYDGHPGLTRVLMPDDWEGHPQRKDYPLGGVSVKYKGATIPPPDERRAYS